MIVKTLLKRKKQNEKWWIYRNTSASKAGVGSTHALLVGSWVVGFFRDGRSAQDPIIIGSIPTQTDGTKDVPTDDIKKKTHVTESGHTVIFDDTPGNIQITIVSKPGQKTKIV